MPDLIDDIIELWEKIISNDEVTVKFTKNDGSIRIMKCTLNFDKIPREDHPKKVSIPQILKLVKNSKIIHVYDLENHGWRSIPFERVEWLDTLETRYMINSGRIL